MAENVFDYDSSTLSPTQKEALEQYTQLTQQDVNDAVPLLERSQWNVQIAITKFFDGEGPDPLAEAAAAAQHIPRPVTQRHENLQQSFIDPPPPRPNQTSRPGPAPRIVPQQPVVRTLPTVLSLLFTPITFGWQVATAVLRTIFYIFTLLPIPLRGRVIGAATRNLKNNTSSRRMLLPRDTAARFKREFEEEYGSHDLPFFEGGFAQALDLAKKDLKFLLVVLISPEHDEMDAFARGTLLSPNVVSFIKDPANSIILWGGNVLDTEAFQVSQEYNCTKFPFSALISLTPKEGSTKMGVIKRLSGLLPADTYTGELRKAIEKYAPELAGVRAQRQEQEMARNLRNAQDEAYERSLAADRERTRRRREAEEAVAAAERAAQEAAKAAARQEEQKKQWKLWRAGRIASEPEASDKDVVRLAIKFPSGERVVRRFQGHNTIEELYAFVECYGLGGNDTTATMPEGYQHDYQFRVASILPREVYHPTDEGTLQEKIGRSGNLIVEDVLEDEDEGS